MRRFLGFLSVGAFVILISGFSILHSSGYSLATGSPYDGGACGQCHTGTVGTVSVTVVANPVFGPGNTYLPGTTYTINAIVSGSFSLYGFDLEMLNSNSSTSVADAGICGPALSSNCQKVTFSSNPTNYTHVAPSGSGNTATFSFQWTAPANGPVYIYCAGLGANGNHASNGDKVATYSMMLSPSTGIEEEHPSEFAFRIFPNPAKEEANFLYHLPEAGSVTLEIFDIQGEQISVLLKAWHGAGLHSYSYEVPPHLSAGSYFIKVSLNGRQIMKKLVVY